MKRKGGIRGVLRVTEVVHWGKMELGRLERGRLRRISELRGFCNGEKEGEGGFASYGGFGTGMGGHQGIYELQWFRT